MENKITVNTRCYKKNKKEKNYLGKHLQKQKIITALNKISKNNNYNNNKNGFIK